MQKRQPIHDLLKRTAKRKRLHPHAVSGAEAGAATEAGTVIRSCGADAMPVRVRAAAPTVVLSGGMQHRRVALRDQQIRVRQKLRNLESAGAACVEVGVASVELADGITRTMRWLTIGMGCGNACGTRYLFSCDLGATHDGHDPANAKNQVTASHWWPIFKCFASRSSTIARLT